MQKSRKQSGCFKMIKCMKKENLHCYYCGTNLTENDWNSIFHGFIHYKSVHCHCGKKNTIKVDFYGSGHDHWNKSEWEHIKIKNKGKIKTLESKLKQRNSTNF